MLIQQQQQQPPPHPALSRGILTSQLKLVNKLSWRLSVRFLPRPACFTPSPSVRRQTAAPPLPPCEMQTHREPFLLQLTGLTRLTRLFTGKDAAVPSHSILLQETFFLSYLPSTTDRIPRQRLKYLFLYLTWELRLSRLKIPVQVK